MAKKKSKKPLFITLGSILVLIVVVLISSGSIGFGKKGIEVNIEKVSKRTITQKVSAVGRINPETEVKISPETSGEIMTLIPKEGDSVKIGELLVRIKPDIVETQLEQSRAASNATKMDIEVRKAEKDRAEADLKRMTELYSKEFISKQEFDRAKAAFEQANSSYRASLSRYDQSLASYKQVERNAERTTIFAPINGIVTALNVEKGEKVVGTEMMQGTEMMIISDLSQMNAVVLVDENDIVLVDIGDTTNVEIDAFPDRIFLGQVIEIGHSAKVSSMGTQDQVTNFEVKIRLLDLDDKLRPGMSCNVEILTETHSDVLSVPLQSVTVRDDDKDKDKNKDERLKKTKKKVKEKIQSVVFLLDKGKAKKVKVETGLSDEGYIEISSGLKEGQEIISGSFMAVSKELFDGAEVIVDTSKKDFSKWKK